MTGKTHKEMIKDINYFSIQLSSLVNCLFEKKNCFKLIGALSINFHD